MIRLRKTGCGVCLVADDVINSVASSSCYYRFSCNGYM